MPTASIKPSKPQNRITNHRTKEASSYLTKKNLTSSMKNMSTPPTKQHQAVNKRSVQSTPDTTSIRSKPPSNHCHSCGQNFSRIPADQIDH